jgi:RHH-type proline utilization regulon transcriptional repressor/proline dehydrogenase/delta 1-pyrroline-5-carboxylate dehydrogenase
MSPATLALARAAIAPLYRISETTALEALAGRAELSAPEHQRVRAEGERLLGVLRAPGRAGWVDRFLQEYSLSSEEGAALLGLAEAYLRVPDSGTADALIRDKLSLGDWKAHLGSADSALVNSATLGLILAQSLTEASAGAASLRGLVARLGEPAIRAGVAAAMQRMGEAFVLGRDINEALRRADRGANRAFRYSFDMLGEGARTARDADAYLEAYRHAIRAVGAGGAGRGDVFSRDSVSVKLSALHPRYEPFQAGRAVPELTARLVELARLAKDGGVGLTVDAEEAERLEMSLSIIEGAARDSSLAGWDGLGMAIQAYQRRAPAVVDWAADLAAATGRRLMVRLVKGAYWDTEIKRTQERGLVDYPVFTRKSATDVSYMACARALLERERLFPAFATHNALTVATVMEWAGARRDFEFQRLHGMGEGLYEGLMVDKGVAVRVYAPVGGYRDLLAYLVRRLLENGANASFVHQIGAADVSDDELLADPVEEARATGFTPHPAIPNPADLYAPERRNSAGLDLSDNGVVEALMARMRSAWAASAAAPRINGRESRGEAAEVGDPADHARLVGTVVQATAADVARALDAADAAQPSWNARGADERAAILERLADLLERDRAQLMALAVREAGKTLADALGEVREATDFCRYYAAQARAHGAPVRLPGPTGELNELSLAGRGVFACVSPWNFPLAIFLGQIAAALATGNTVVAKPAPQTPLIAAHAVRLAFEAGVPGEVLQLIPGGADVGGALIADPRVAGVAFTGSTASARRIARTLLEDEARPLVPLIAETGGLNAMLVDSTALPEQVTADVVTSAFLSAGQRCSALRLLCLHEDVAPAILEMLKGAMDELVIGDPADPATDVGPVIDAEAKGRIDAHVERWRARVVHTVPIPAGLERGTFVAPTLIRLENVGELDREIFGPILHVTTFAAGAMNETLDQITASGFGLTLGVHTRIGAAAAAVRARARVGNLYVNRSMIGAVVGVQPFGGEGLSGTGPKAGGPHYLPRFCVERTWTVDTTSAGGNATLLSLEG